MTETSCQTETCQTENSERAHDERVFRPNTDVLQRDNEVVLYIDVPGATEEGLDITVDRNRMTVRASVAGDPADRKYVRREYAVGDYVRTYRLSEEVDRDGIDASLENGVLRIVLPKIQQAATRKITVKAR